MERFAYEYFYLSIFIVSVAITFSFYSIIYLLNINNPEITKLYNPFDGLMIGILTGAIGCLLFYSFQIIGVFDKI